MKCTSFLVLAAIAVSAVNATESTPSAGHLRGLQTIPSSINFGTLNQLASTGGIRAGEEVLKTVNGFFPKDAMVSGDKLLSIAKRVLDKDATLEKADKATREIVDALRKAIAKLFPTQAFESALRGVVSKIPTTGGKRNLAGLDSIGFSGINQLASINGLLAGEQVLKAVNDLSPTKTKVSGTQLIDIAKRVLDKDAALEKADKATRDIVDSLRKAIAKLYPGQVFDVALRGVLSKIPK